ncbi:MAG: FAD-dependent oxidoreductase, partial [Actinomycetes bacterium]
MNIMRHDAHGWWLRDAGLESVQPQPALGGRAEADVVIVGGGYSGMWAAWFLSDLIDPERILLLDAGICGTGPSGRNAGFCQGLAESVVQLEADWGGQAARALIERTEELAGGVGAWASDLGLEIDFRQAGEMVVACGRGQDKGSDELIES